MSRRCLIPADGHYEWTTTTKTEEKIRGSSTLLSCAIQLRQPLGLQFETRDLQLHDSHRRRHSPTNQLHDRMPIILGPEAYETWLSRDTPAALKQLLREHNLNELLQFHRVSRDVNSSKFDGDPGCINPL